MPANKKNTGRFKPGQSGNPNGRPKVPKEIKDMLKAATPDAAGLLIQCIHDDKCKMEIRVKAATEILDRVFGKATQPIDGKMDNTVVVQFAEEIEEYGA